MTQGSWPLAPDARLAKRAEDATIPSTLPLEMLLHDLSAPSRHIGFFVARLRASIPDSTLKQADCFRRIEQNLAAERDLLQQSRLLLSDERRPDGARDRAVRAEPELTDLVASCQPEFDEKGVLLGVDLNGDAAVRIDPKVLRRVVLNLMNNALASTPPGGLVTIVCRVEEDLVVFRVSDTGSGFTRDQAERLSQAAVGLGRGVDPTETWAGLGLLVCHRLVTSYGGQLSVSSPGPGKGSTFSFSLPLAA